MEFGTYVLLAALLVESGFLIYTLLITAPRNNHKHYVLSLDAERGLLDRTKIVIHEDIVVWAVVRDGEVKVEYARVAKEVSKVTPAPAIANGLTTEQSKELAKWEVALRLVQESVKAAPTTDRIIPASAFTSGDKWGEACSVLKTRGWISSLKGGSNAKTVVNNRIGTVSDLLPMVVAEFIALGGNINRDTNKGAV